MGNGKVYLVGAGPGSADLLTLRGSRAIKKADVIVCDSLLSPFFLSEVGVNVETTEVIYLKDKNGLKTQDEINQIMLDAASSGKTVARVKTGDPNIFGRGAEELSFLNANGIGCEIVPGLTVATAISSLADIPITSREQGRSFAVVTARCSGGVVNQSLPKADTLIIFMGVSVLSEIVAKLKIDGWPDDTPISVLERVSMPWQRQVQGNLNDICELVSDGGLSSPAIVVVGVAAAVQSESQRPRILFTGLNPSNFMWLGSLMLWPAIRVVKNEQGYDEFDEIMAGLVTGQYNFLVFTSKTTVRLFFSELFQNGFDARLLKSKIVACGAGTKQSLEEYGIIADITPDNYGSEGIVDSLKEGLGASALVVQSKTAPEAMVHKLLGQLGSVRRLCLHSVEPNPELGKKLPDYDVIYFTCPSGVRAYYNKYGVLAFEKEVWCIGDATAKQLTKYGIESKVVNPYVS